MAGNPMEYLWPGIVAAQAIYVAAKLRIPDLLASGPKTAAELAADCGAQPAALECLLRALGTLEMFERTADGRFRNTTSHGRAARVSPGITARERPVPALGIPLAAVGRTGVFGAHGRAIV